MGPPVASFQIGHVMKIDLATSEHLPRGWLSTTYVSGFAFDMVWSKRFTQA